MLHVVKNHHAVSDVCHLIALVAHLVHAQLGIKFRADGIVETDDDALLVEVDDSLLIAQLLTFGSRVHNQGNASHLIAVTRSKQTFHDLFLYTTEVLVVPQQAQILAGLTTQVVFREGEPLGVLLLTTVYLCDNHRHGMLYLLFELLVIGAVTDDKAHLVIRYAK